MKKLLSILGALGLTAVSASSIVSCNNSNTSDTSNVLKDSYGSSYTTKNVGNLGVTLNNNVYQFKFKDIFGEFLRKVIVPKVNSSVSFFVISDPSTSLIPKEGELCAQVLQKTADGVLTASGTSKTVSYEVTLKLFKGVKSGDTLMYVDQNQMMDITININMENIIVDISSAKVLDGETIHYDPNSTYAALNSNIKIINFAVSAINAVQLNTLPVNDATHFVITNDKTGTDKQISGTVVTFTVTANLSDPLITGVFTFKVTLVNVGKVDINNVKITDPGNIKAYTNSYYSQLNTDNRIFTLVVNAINNTYSGLDITNDDFTIKNNQSFPSQKNQQGGTTVIFTVTAQPNSKKIEQFFTFSITLNGEVADLTSGGTTHSTLTLTAGQTYAELNAKDSRLVTAILPDSFENIEPGLVLSWDDDYVITNDQQPTGIQTAGVDVTFTITAKPTSTKAVGAYQITLKLVSA